MNIKYIRTTDDKKYDLRDKRITDTDTGVATQSANGLLSSTDKKKLDGIARGAEVNQNAFSNIKIGNTTIAADGKTDTVELTAGNNITLTPDATNDKITIAATDTNTTYTFKGGANQFTVTPSNGTAQTVSVTPSIANNVTGSDLTANTIILGNGNSGVKKSGKTIVTTLGSDDTTLPTSKAVKAAIDALPEPMIFKGTLGTGGTITSLPAAASGNNGFTYKVITAGTYASQSAKVGDVFISNGNSWNLIPSGDEPSGTVTNVATGTGLTGGPITTSGTISHADTSSQASVSNSGRTYIQSVTLDGMGHVTGLSSATETVVNTDRYVNNAAFADDSTSAPASPVKMTLTRAGSDTATVTANLPKVSSASAGVAPKGAAVTTQSQSTKFLREDGTWATPSYTQPGGDVTGPSSSTDAHVAVFNGATGKVIKDSGFTIAKSVPSDAVFTDTQVTQHLTANNVNLSILLSTSGITDTTKDVTSYTIRNNSIYANPSTGTITANKFNGSATHADTSSQSGSISIDVNAASYWGKLWEIDVTNYQWNDRDVTFLLQSAYDFMLGTLHVKIRQRGANGSGAYSFACSMRLTSGNIPRSRLRLYYNNSTGNCQLWCNCKQLRGVINAKILHKTGRIGTELQSLGTLYNLNAGTEQTLPGTGYEYIEPVYAVISEWNDVQNKPSSYPIQVDQHTANNVNYPLVWAGSPNANNEVQTVLYKSFDKLMYNPSRNWLKSGTLELYPENNYNYSEGLRIHSATDGWASLVFCGTDNTGTSGTSVRSWGLYTNDANFYITRGAADKATANRLWGHSNGYTIGNTTESGYNFTVGGDSRLIGTTTTSLIVPASDYTYSIGSDTAEYAHIYSRNVYARYLNASGPVSSNKDLYLGYYSTSGILFYTTDIDGNNRKRVALFKQDGNAEFDHTVTAASFVGPLTGNASSASKLTTDAGSATQPVYFSGGVPTACSYQLNKTVPSNAVFTDTHYTTHLYAGSGTAANAATTNGSTKLTVVDNTTPRESVTIKGTGGTTVTSDANGVVTINSTDTFSKQFTFDSPSVYLSNYDFIILPKGYNACSSGTCYFVEITALIQQSDSWVTRCVKFMTHCKWFSQNAGLRITQPVYTYGLISNGPILYHDKAEGVDVGTETRSANVCVIPFNIPVSSGIAAVNIKVEGPDVSECRCDRAYSNWKWSNVEPSWTTA